MYAKTSHFLSCLTSLPISNASRASQRSTRTREQQSGWSLKCCSRGSAPARLPQRRLFRPRVQNWPTTKSSQRKGRHRLQGLRRNRPSLQPKICSVKSMTFWRKTRLTGTSSIKSGKKTLSYASNSLVCAKASLTYEQRPSSSCLRV